MVCQEKKFNKKTIKGYGSAVMTGLENGDLLIQVTAWAGLTICFIFS
jgi:hypothetical protein